MDFYIKKYSSNKETIEKYKQSGESYDVSNLIEIGGKKYREVSYKKTMLGIKGKAEKGIIFIDENSSIVSNYDILKKLCFMAYKCESIFSKKSIDKFKKFVQNKNEIEAKKLEYDQVISCLEACYRKNLKGCNVIIDVLKELIKAKTENRSAVEEFLEKVNTFENKDTIFTEEMVNSIEPFYENVFVKNFNCVKVLNKGRNYYEEVRKILDKQKTKPVNLIMGMGLRGGYAKVDNFIESSISVLLVYDDVIDMNDKSYIEYFHDIENGKINKKIETIRN